MEKTTNRQRITTAAQLTFGEQLIIWRRRKNWKQGKAAKFFQLSIFNYKKLEYGHHIPRKKYELGNLDPLSSSEKCFLYRRRNKKTQVQIAKEMGLCRNWLRMQEIGEVDSTKLLKFWEG